MDHDLLERMLHGNKSAELAYLPISFLQSITNNFSEDRKIGSGGFADVYKGVLPNGTVVAVKKLKLSGMPVAHVEDIEKKFPQEISSLMKLKHENIVQILGYCADTQSKLYLNPINNKYVLVDDPQRFICFEFVPEGSLDKHISDASRGLDWRTRYHIIKGICMGLHYLHQNKIVHLDLKPANVLLHHHKLPKIADFGLARCFDEEQTRVLWITSNKIGTLGYMAPEYIDDGVITLHADIYSLGIIITEILTGKKDNLLVENVLKSWSTRFHTSQGGTWLEHVRVCAEISLECRSFEPEKRPTTQHIIESLEKLEFTYGSIETGISAAHVRVARIGLWGGLGGPDYLDVEVVPDRLESLTIGSGSGICSLGFSYTDRIGQQHPVGPCGGKGEHEKGGCYETIYLSPSEHLRVVSGTIGPFFVANSVIITSLTFTTNERTCGPYGEARGTPFQIPVQNNGSIVGFFARAGWYLDSLGIYVKPKQHGGIDKEEAVLVKIGPWGGNGGSPWDIEVEPKHLKSVIIHSGVVVESVKFSYIGQNGQNYNAGPWGGPGGSICAIDLGPSEFLTAVYGTTGPFSDAPSDVVTSLTFVSNAHIYGPFGRGGGVPFEIPMQGNGSILGFFGRASKFVDAIGVYANPQELIQRKIGLTKTGPWGGIGGMAYYVHDELEPKPHRLKSMTIHYDHVIHSLKFSYSDHSGTQHSAGPWGHPGGKFLSFELGPSEYVQAICGTFGPFGTSPNVITSLRFGTNKGQVYGPIGHDIGMPFNVRTEKDDRIVGFFGRASGSYLEAIGAYVHTN